MKIALLFILGIIFFPGCNHSTVIKYTGMKDYTEAFNSAILNSNYVVIKPGFYPVTAPIILHSNLVIEGEGEVILLKKTAYSHVFTNQSALEDYSGIWDTSITIENIIIDANEIGNQVGSSQLTSNGDLSFNKVYDLKLKDIKIKNGDPILFGIHLQSVKNAEVSNYFYEGKKDGIHINGGCENIEINGFDICSFDDAFGIMTDDYPRVQHNTADIRNIEIKNGISRARTPQSGFFLRLMTGSWQQWKKGNKYNVGHTVNFQNRQYKKLNSGKIVSQVPPVHLHGDSLYPDGIIWRNIGKGNNKTSNIYNLRLSNIKLEDGRDIVRTINADSNDYGEYPGTENTSIVDSIFITGHRLKIFRGKVGLWKTIPPTEYFQFAIMILCLLLLILIVIYYLRIKNRNKPKTIASFQD